MIILLFNQVLDSIISTQVNNYKGCHIFIVGYTLFNNYIKDMKTATLVVIFMALLSLSSSVQIKTEGKKHFPHVYSNKQVQAFVEPIEIYNGKIKAQEVMINYSKAIDPEATKVEFMIFFDIGDADTPDIRINFVRV